MCLPWWLLPTGLVNSQRGAAEGKPGLINSQREAAEGEPGLINNPQRGAAEGEPDADKRTKLLSEYIV